MLFFALPSATHAFTVYQIGNSLTWDSSPVNTEVMIDDAGVSYDHGHHIKSNSSLTTIWNNPEVTNTPLTDFGTFTLALPENDWDAITLQAFGQLGNTFAMDVAAAQNFVTLARSTGNNTDAQFYVYEGWAHHVEMPSWLLPWTVASTQHRKDYFETLADTLSDELDEPILVVPTGDVVYRMKLAIEAGNFPQWSALSNIYRDPIHMAGPGGFLAATTVATTLTKQNPIGPFNPNPWYPDANNQAEALALQRIVWDVVANHPYSGVTTLPGDYDGSGVVDSADRNWWLGSFGNTILSHAADGNRDGAINIADYVVWRDHHSGSTGAANITVPEPAAITLILIAATAVLLYRSPRSGAPRLTP